MELNFALALNTQISSYQLIDLLTFFLNLN
jgi:hypothetical protein